VTDMELIEWLLKVGGPIIRYRTATELSCSRGNGEQVRLQDELPASPEVRKWLGILGKCPVACGAIHGSRDTHAENAVGKLLEYGLRADVDKFDQLVRPFLALIQPSDDHELLHEMSAGQIAQLVLLPFLIRAGYADDARVSSLFLSRLRALHRTAKRGRYDVLLNEKEKENLPKSWRGKNIYRPEHFSAYPLPTIYDYYALAHYPAKDARTVRMIADVVAYLSHAEFQAIPNAYLWNRARGRFHSAGRVWLAVIPQEEAPANRQHQSSYPGRLVLFLELSARFSAARDTDWFRKGVAELEGFRTERGTYQFPSEYLTQKANSYHLYQGNHMGLGENRRRADALEIESTFRMLRLRKLMGVPGK
jgi:hypothetical protein